MGLERWQDLRLQLIYIVKGRKKRPLNQTPSWLCCGLRTGMLIVASAQPISALKLNRSMNGLLYQ
eukprot:scaffold2560_cov35-Attheya_sp.AAC.2